MWNIKINLYSHSYVFLFFMLILLVPSRSAHAKTYSPGWEIGEWSAIAAFFGASALLDSQNPWVDKPLIGGQTDLTFHTSTVPGALVFGGAGTIALSIALLPNNEGFFNFIAYDNFKGFVESASVTLLLASFTKNVFGRKRPSYDNYPASEKEKEGRKSFMSGHSSLSFCVATYASLFTFEHLGAMDDTSALGIKLLTAVGLHSLAAFVAYSRVMDNKHHVSDVVVSGLAGSTLAALFYALHNGWFSDRTSLHSSQPPWLTAAQGYSRDSYLIAISGRF